MSDDARVRKAGVDNKFLMRPDEARAARSGSRGPLKKAEKAAEDFEALIIFTMLKELNKSGYPTRKEYSQDTYMSIAYDTVSRFIAANKGLGIKELLMRYYNKGDDVKF